MSHGMKPMKPVCQECQKPWPCPDSLQERGFIALEQAENKASRFEHKYERLGEEMDKVIAASEAKDATIAVLRADIADLLPMRDADAFTIGNLDAERDMLRAALEKISTVTGADDAGGSIWQVAEVAKHALAGTPAEPAASQRREAETEFDPPDTICSMCAGLSNDHYPYCPLALDAAKGGGADD